MFINISQVKEILLCSAWCDRDSVTAMTCQPAPAWVQARCPGRTARHSSTNVRFLLAAVLCATGCARAVEDLGRLQRELHDGNATTSPVHICFNLPSTHTGVVGATVAVVDPAQPSWIVTHVVRMFVCRIHLFLRHKASALSNGQWLSLFFCTQPS